MNIKQIEFASPSAVVEDPLAPWNSPGSVNYQDLIIKPELASLRYKFPLGQTWFRIVPALQASARGWMLGVHALKYDGGRHAHARTLRPGSKGVFDVAYQWCKSHQPESLYSKSNKVGHKLLADPLCLFWIIVEVDGKLVPRLVLESGYDGTRGGTEGIGHQIFKKMVERDENGDLVENPVHSEAGFQVCVDKSQPKGTRFPSYTLRVGRVPVPMSQLLGKMETSEIERLCPLENVVHLPTEEEEWDLLAKAMNPAIVSRIRAAT